MPKEVVSVHPYYQAHRAALKKDMDSFLGLIARELEEAAGKPYSQLLEEIWDCYEREFLEKLPYIGGSGTRNLTGAFAFAAMGEVCRRRYGMTLERWGYLTTESYRRYFDRIPGPVRALAGKAVKQPRLINWLLRRKDAKNAANAEKNPGSFITRVQPPTQEYPAVYHTLVCPLYEFARAQGYMEYMPYICNLDYVMFEAMNVPFYREKTCAAGDGCCDFKLRSGAPVNPAWPCHSLTPGDPLK